METILIIDFGRIINGLLSYVMMCERNISALVL